MPGKFAHEILYRGNPTLSALAALRLTICGVGAVGSNLADHLARHGLARLRAIDHDRVEEHNISTQLYGEREVGLWKVEALRSRLFGATGIEIETFRKQMTASNSRRLLKESDLIVDAFDNSASRQVVRDAAIALQIPCLHIGLYEDYFEVIWNEFYRVPNDVGQQVCDYPLARNLILLAMAAATESIFDFLQAGDHTSWTGTLKDLQILPLAQD